MNEICCDQSLLDLRRGSRQGRILGVYHKCFHVMLPEGRLVTVFGNQVQKVPMAIYTDAPADCPFGKVALAEGMPVFFENGVLSIPGAFFWCRLGGEGIGFTRKPLPVPQDVLGLETAIADLGKNNGAGAFREAWQAYLHHAHPLPEDATVLRRIAGLLEAVDGTPPGVEAALLDCIGLGIGLTPSADDMVCGIAAAAWLYWPRAVREQFLGTLEAFCRNQGSMRTPWISCQQLLLTARGQLSDPVYQLAEALSRNQSWQIRDLAASVMDYGSSSGTELCMGFLAGLRKATVYCESERNHEW